MSKHFGALVLCLVVALGCDDDAQQEQPGSDASVDTSAAPNEVPEDSIEPLPSNESDSLDAPPSDARVTPIDDLQATADDLQAGEVGSEEMLTELEVAGIECSEGTQVEVQSVLHLQAVPPPGYEAATYKWSVRMPPGAQFAFVPSDAVANPTFAANMVGIYTFSVEMTDPSGAPIPPPDPFDVDVICTSKIHVELFWDTPADDDQTDTGPNTGTDVDLHFTNPLAYQNDANGDGLPDPWFDPVYDCYWFNPNPEWGAFEQQPVDSIQPSDDPTLDLDDTDGAGPENINLDLPEPSVYKVGVHYWDDHGYGDSFATVRVYIDGILASELGPIQLAINDIWSVCEIDGVDGTITPLVALDGEPIIYAACNPFGGGWCP